VLDDPYAFVTRQVVFAIVARRDGGGDERRLRVVQGARRVPLRAHRRTPRLLLLLLGLAQGLDRISFDLGPINFQPAELAKFTTLIALCAYLAEERSDEVSYARFVGGLILVGVPALLIIAQPDLGSASVIVTIAMGVLLVAGAKPKYIAMISFLSLATVTRRSSEAW
jgi:rod shape determining protein RodA